MPDLSPIFQVLYRRSVLQVIQHMATEAERQARDEQLEAILGLKMMHPNIVRTFQFATKDRSVRLSRTLNEETCAGNVHLPPFELGTADVNPVLEFPHNASHA